MSLGHEHFQLLNHLGLEAGGGNCPFIFSSSLNGSKKKNNAIQRRLGLKRAYRSCVSMTDFFSLQSFLLRDVGWSWELIDGLGGGCG